MHQDPGYTPYTVHYLLYITLPQYTTSVHFSSYLDVLAAVQTSQHPDILTACIAPPGPLGRIQAYLLYPPRPSSTDKSRSHSLSRPRFWLFRLSPLCAPVLLNPSIAKGTLLADSTAARSLSCLAPFSCSRYST